MQLCIQLRSDISHSDKDFPVPDIAIPRYSLITPPASPNPHRLPPLSSLLLSRSYYSHQCWFQNVDANWDCSHHNNGWLLLLCGTTRYEEDEEWGVRGEEWGMRDEGWGVRDEGWGIYIYSYLSRNLFPCPPRDWLGHAQEQSLHWGQGSPCIYLHLRNCFHPFILHQVYSFFSLSFWILRISSFVSMMKFTFSYSAYQIWVAAHAHSVGRAQKLNLALILFIFMFLFNMGIASSLFSPLLFIHIPSMFVVLFLTVL